MPFPNKEQRRANRHAYQQQQGQVKTQRGKVIAKFAPGVTSIKLYANGEIVSSMHGNGSAVGAVARVDQSGSKHVIRDTRQTYLTIEGPRASIAAKLTSNGGVSVKQARQFAAAVNQWSQAHPVLASVAAPTTAASALGASSPPADVIDQLERLGKLRESGVLTQEEFLAQKAALLESATG